MILVIFREFTKNYDPPCFDFAQIKVGGSCFAGFITG